jgi:hypothetical protein
MKPKKRGRLLGLALAATGLWAILAEPAHADGGGRQTMLSADLDYGQSAGSGIGGGWGFGIRIGQRFHVPLVALDPELGFTFHDFTQGLEPKMYRGILGLRLGFLEIVRPGVYGHIGIGRIDFSVASELSHTAFTYDFGAFVEVTLIPLLDIGVHVSYDGIASGDHVDAVNWVTVGGHVALVF